MNTVLYKIPADQIQRTKIKRVIKYCIWSISIREVPTLIPSPEGQDKHHKKISVCPGLLFGTLVLKVRYYYYAQT